MQLICWKYAHDQKKFLPDRVMDTASSVIWCERWQEPGEFQADFRATQELLRYFTDNEILITRSGTKAMMIPEKAVLQSSAENGDTLEISGRSAESIPSRRVIQQDTSMMRFPNGAALLYYLYQENIGSWWYYHHDSTHRSSYRFIPFFKVGTVTELPDDIEIKAQPFGENLGSFTTTVCRACGIGFRVRMGTDQSLRYEFYRGTDRSSAVIFSRDFQNLGDTEYSFDKRTYFNEIFIAGDGFGKDRARQVMHNSEFAEGYTLREKFVDASSVSRNTLDTEGEPMSEVLYNLLLAKMALTELNASKEEIKFDGKALPSGQFAYRKDYFLGDTVTVKSPYGITGKAVVTEVTEAEDQSGYMTVPTFSDWVE